MLLMKGKQVPPLGLPFLKAPQRLSAPLQEALPQVREGGWPAFRPELLKGSKQPWLQLLWRCPFRQQDVLLLSGINRQKGEQSGFGHEG
jgi:hypothetical protein